MSRNERLKEWMLAEKATHPQRLKFIVLAAVFGIPILAVMLLVREIATGHYLGPALLCVFAAISALRTKREINRNKIDRSSD